MTLRTERATPREPWIRPESKEKLKNNGDSMGQFMASGGAATAIIAAIGKSIGVPMSLGVGLTLGLGLAPLLWLGTSGLKTAIERVVDEFFPQSNFNKHLLYFPALLITVAAAFFFVNAVVGAVHILPFIGVIALTCLLLNFMPKPSRIPSYIKTILRPDYRESGIPLWQRIFKSQPQQAPIPIRDLGEDSLG